MGTRKLGICGLVIGGGLLLLMPIALAFPYTYSWHAPATSNIPNGKPGSGGNYATGSASDKGITCAHCHIKGEGKIGITITTTPPWDKVGGKDAYKPGTTYQFVVSMTGEHRGLGDQHQENSMNLTIENVNGKPVGVFMSDSGASSDNCPATFPATAPVGTTYVWGDCHGILSIEQPSNTTWRFDW